ncbi:MAG: serine hydrolase, partial [Nostoc sp.]
MKLRWLLLSLTSIFLLSSPVKANLNTNQVDSADGGSGNQSDLQLPELKFVPPIPSSNFLNPTGIPKYTGIVPLGREIS